MSDPEPVEWRRWLGYAQDDPHAAEVNRSDPSVAPRVSCFLAQQAAEEAIKAGLVALQIAFPLTHNLDGLRNLLPDEWRIKGEPGDLAPLTFWAIEARYPGDWPDATPEDAREAVEQAREVVESIKDDLIQRGFILQ